MKYFMKVKLFIDYFTIFGFLVALFAFALLKNYSHVRPLESSRFQYRSLIRTNISRRNKGNRPSTFVISSVKPSRNARLSLLIDPVIKSGGTPFSLNNL